MTFEKVTMIQIEFHVLFFFKFLLYNSISERELQVVMGDLKKVFRWFFVFFILLSFLIEPFSFIYSTQKPLLATHRPNTGCQICCDPFSMVSKDQIGSAWFQAIEQLYYQKSASIDKPLRDLSIEELRIEFDEWYFHQGWKYHLRYYGWAGKMGTCEYYHYDPWDQYCWEYTIREYLQPVVGYGYRRAVKCDTVRVEIAALQLIHCLINCKTRKKLQNQGYHVFFFVIPKLYPYNEFVFCHKEELCF
jgi:hypothetical protein